MIVNISNSDLSNKEGVELYDNLKRFVRKNPHLLCNHGKYIEFKVSDGMHCAVYNDCAIINGCHIFTDEEDFELWSVCKMSLAAYNKRVKANKEKENGDKLRKMFNV